MVPALVAGMDRFRFLSAVLSAGLVAGLASNAAGAEASVVVKVHSVSGTAPKVEGKTLAVGTTLNARDIVQTGQGTIVELMVNMGATDEPGTLVRVTPNSRLTVLSLAQLNMDNETLMDFEVAATKIGGSGATLAATATE